MAADMSPAGILAVDAQGVILLANQEIERLFGWTREELLGQPIEALLPSRYRHGHAGLIKSFFDTPHQRPLGAGRDLRGMRKDGTEFPVEIGLRPVKTSRGVVTLASVLDVTTRLEREKASRQSQKLEALGTLAGGIAHDFNNILMAIVGHSELARMSQGDTASHDLEQVMSAAERGRQLVQRILAFSRTREVKRAPVDLSRVVREAADLLRSSLPSTIEMKLSLSATTPKVLSDEIELHQVVMNLCTNA
ncbi:MAG: PAS domain S-box protein, partial [Gemmatimonadetes bacterium]|nr:PAS domain S-box protein [Gemmatimonadota bacterium]